MILTEEQIGKIDEEHKKWLKSIESSLVEEIDRRAQVSKDMKNLFEEVKLFEGGTFNADQLCRSVEIQKKVHNLQPIALPKFLGYFNYNRYFKGFEGSIEDFKREHPELQGPGVPGLGYPGVDLKDFSETLRQLLKSEGNAFALNAEKLLSFEGVGRAVLSGYLYLYDPDRYPLVNGASIGAIDKMAEITNSQKRNAAKLGREFLNITKGTEPRLTSYLSWLYILNEIKVSLSLKTFHELDWFCWQTQGKGKVIKSKQHWLYAPGRDARYWAEFYDKGIMAIGWDELGDLQNYDSKEEIREKMIDIFGYKTSAKNNAKTCFDFLHSIKEGDLIFAKKGTKEILGYGIGQKGYLYDSSRTEYKHVRKVNWIKRGLWHPSDKFAIKTLTNIDSYPEFIKEIKNLLEVSELPDDSIDYLILSYKEESPWKDVIGKSYHYGISVPNHKKIKEGVDFVLLEKNVGFVGYGVIGPIESISGKQDEPETFNANFASFEPIDPPRKLSDDIKQKLISLPGYNVQHAIKVINRDLFDMITQPERGFSSTWIFQANPAYYDLIGALKSLKLMTWEINQHKDRIHSGDMVYLWQSGSNAGIFAVAEVLSEPKIIPMFESERPYIKKSERFSEDAMRVSLRIRHVLEKPLLKEKLSQNEVFSKHRIITAPYGSNFSVTLKEADFLEKVIQEWGLPIYTKEDALKHLFLEQEEFDYILDRLKTKKNIILQGPPGVGKTFIGKRLAYTMIGIRDDSRVAMIQFHQSYSYEDFIQGFRPNEEGKFELRNGVFYEFCMSTMHDNTSKPFIFIIDEINRGNLSKIFGELLMLIEPDKRGPEFAVPLTYSKTIQDRFWIPENVFIIGTMNTADRSLAMVDYALRRRFSFNYLEPKFNSDKFAEYLKNFGVSGDLIVKIIDRMSKLNNTIAEDTKNLGLGYRIGHSYFCPINKDMKYDENWYHTIIKSEIEPLLYEYWFDDTQKAKSLVETLLS